MGREDLIHRQSTVVGNEEYEILVFLREDGRHVAKTFFTAGDVIINDGLSLEEALHKHQRLLPLAVDSRRILKDFRHPPHDC